MITHKQLIKHKFITADATEQSPFYMHGKVNGVLSGGVFHFPMVGEWYQCKNISHLKHLYHVTTGEKLERMNDNEWAIISGLLNIN